MEVLVLDPLVEMFFCHKCHLSLIVSPCIANELLDFPIKENRQIITVPQMDGEFNENCCFIMLQLFLN